MSSLWYPRMSHASSPAPGFGSLFRMLDEFDKYANQQVGSTLGSGQSFTPKFDVAEHEKEYTLQGELPGVPPENVTIEFTDPQTLVIRGHVERKHTEGDPSLARIEAPEATKKIENGSAKKGGAPAKEGTSQETEQPKESNKSKYWLSERSYGEFSRVFSFPSNVDQDKVEARFNHGILDIKVPKAEKKGARRIEIK